MKELRTVSHAQMIRLGGVPLAASVFLLALFPLVRPFGDRSGNSVEIAQTFASTPWIAAHIMGTLGFVLLPIGLFFLYMYLRGTQAERHALRGLVLCWIGVGLFLPIFGTEAFAMRAIGNEALNQNDLSLLALSNSIRSGPQIILLVSSLTLLAIGAIMIAIAVWKSGSLPKWSGIPFAIGLALFLPLFPQDIRIIDGLLIGSGGVWLAVNIMLNRRTIVEAGTR